MAYYKCGSIHPTQNSNVVVDTSSGAIANFETPLAMPLLDAQIDVNAVQDLHGQSGAYPPGGGKNIFPIKNVTTIPGITLTVRDDGSLLINGTASQSFNATVKADLKAGNYVLSCRFTGTLPTEGAARCQVYDPVTGLSKQISNPDPSEGYASVAVAEDLTDVEFRIRISGGFNYNNVVYYPQLESGSSPTPFAPYSNICPINGWDEINLIHCRKNLYQYDESKVSTGTTSTGSTRSYMPLGLKGACTLTFSASLKEGQEPTAHFINIGKMKNGIITVLQSFIQASTITTRVLPFAEGDDVVLVSASESTYAITSSLSRYNIQIEVNSEATNFEETQISTTVIQLNNTYYGGRFIQDKSGKRKFVVTHSLYTFTGNESFSAMANNRCYTTGIDDIYIPSEITEKTVISTHYLGASQSSPNNNTVYKTTGNKALVFQDDINGVDTVTFKAFLTNQYANNTPVIIVYKISEPIIIDLPDGTPFKSFPGVNNIFADTGDISVSYIKLVT